MKSPKKRSPMKKPPNQVLAVDVGGNHVKFLLTGQENPRKFDSGPSMTPEEMEPSRTA
jgi:hexokinase